MFKFKTILCSISLLALLSGCDSNTTTNGVTPQIKEKLTLDSIQKNSEVSQSEASLIDSMTLRAQTQTEKEFIDESITQVVPELVRSYVPFGYEKEVLELETLQEESLRNNVSIMRNLSDFYALSQTKGQRASDTENSSVYDVMASLSSDVYEIIQNSLFGYSFSVEDIYNDIYETVSTTLFGEDALTTVELNVENNYAFIETQAVTFLANSEVKNSTQFVLQLGSEVGATDIAEVYSTTNSLVVDKIDTELSYVNATVWYLVDGEWQRELYVLQLQQGDSSKATDEISTIDLVKRSQFAIIAKEKLTFNFDKSYVNAQRYALQIGTDYGKNEYFDGSVNSATINVESLNTGEEKEVYATAWYFVDNSWEYETFEFRLK